MNIFVYGVRVMKTEILALGLVAGSILIGAVLGVVVCLVLELIRRIKRKRK